MPPVIDQIDHLVLNCRDVEATAAWYERVLGMRREVFGDDRRLALKFGNQKINLRPTQAANWETGAADAPGSADFCLITNGAPEETVRHLKACGVEVTAGPTTRTGARGKMTSVYCRDPDGNLVEIAKYP
jgi:catechol 2,3-dioxygenase-like lactoylglutathione lyase family enzyme